MPERRSDAVDLCGGAYNDLSAVINELPAIINNIPRIRPGDGQGHYNARNAFLQEHLHPQLGVLRDARARLGAGLRMLEEYLEAKNTSKNGRDQTTTNLGVYRERLAEIDARLRDLLGPLRDNPRDEISLFLQELDE